MRLQNAVVVAALLIALGGCDRAPGPNPDAGSNPGGRGGAGGSGGAGAGDGGSDGQGGEGGTGGGAGGSIPVVPGDLPTACTEFAEAPGPCDGAFCLTEGPGFSWTNDAESPAPGHLRVLGFADLDYRIAYFDGSRWSWETPPIDNELLVAFAARAPDDIWAVGSGVFHFDGSAWTEIETPVAPPASGRFTDVVAHADEVWVLSPSLDVMLQWDGTAWAQASLPITAEHFFFDESGGLWLQGPGQIARQGSGGWQVFELGSDQHPISKLGGSLGEGLFVVREKAPLLMWDGEGFAPFEIADFEPRHVVAWDGGIWITGHDPVAGENALYRWIDGSLEKLEVPGDRPYLGTLTSAGTSLWSVGVHELSRWDGDCWQVHGRTLLVPVLAGTSEAYLWGFDNYGHVARWNGTSWRPVTKMQAGLFDAWAAGPDEVWAAGDSGSVLRVKDGDLSEISGGSLTGRLLTITGIGPEDVWVAGEEGVVWHWNGVAWEDRTIPGGWEIVDLATAGGEVWAIGVEWIDYDLSSEFDSVALRWNGAGWDEMRSDLRVRYDSVAIRAAGDVWIFSEGFALRWDGVSWQVENPRGNQIHANAIWVDDDGAWIGDEHGFYSIGTQPTEPHLLPRGVQALCRDGGDATWLVDGLGRVHRFAGGVLEPIDAPGSVRFVACSGPDDVWFGDWYSGLAHWDGTRISQVDSFGWSSIGALWSPGPDDVWVVAESKPVRWDGAGWTELAVPGMDAFAIHGSAANDVWVVGASGRVSRWDGTAWTSIPAPTTSSLVQVLSFGPADVWVRSSSDELLHWDGSAWALGWAGDVREIAGHGGELWISAWPHESTPYAPASLNVSGPDGVWRPVEHAVWSSGLMAGVLLEKDGRFSAASEYSYFRSGAVPTEPWHESQLPVWARELLWEDATGITWIHNGSGLMRWDQNAP